MCKASRRDQKLGEGEGKHIRQSEILVKCFLHSLIPTTEANRDLQWMSEGFQLLSLLRQVSSPSCYLREMPTVICSHAKSCISKKQWSYSEVLQKQLITPKLNLNLKAVEVYISTLCFTHESFHLLLKIAARTFLFTSTQEQNSLRHQGNRE